MVTGSHTPLHLSKRSRKVTRDDGNKLQTCGDGCASFLSTHASTHSLVANVRRSPTESLAQQMSHSSTVEMSWNWTRRQNFGTRRRPRERLERVFKKEGHDWFLQTSSPSQQLLVEVTAGYRTRLQSEGSSSKWVTRREKQSVSLVDRHTSFMCACVT